MGRRSYWLIAAMLLLAGAVWFMSRGKRALAPTTLEVKIPRHMSAADLLRLARRRRPPAFIVTPSLPTDPVAAQSAPEHRDPLLVALPTQVKQAAIVVEARVLRDSPVGQLLVDCFLGPPDGQRAERLRSKTGLDFFQDLDRVALADETVIITGRLGHANWAELFPDMEPQPLGPHTRLFKPASGGEVALVWNDEMLMVGRAEDEIRAAADRLEGRAAVGLSLIGESDSYGEVYGLVKSAALANLFAHERPDVAARLQTMTDHLKVHVDASHDVGLVADADGTDPAGTLDLAHALGGVLTMGRAAALAQGNGELAAFLDHASVQPSHAGSLRIELALPLEFLQAQLKDCPGRQP